MHRWGLLALLFHLTLAAVAESPLVKVGPTAWSGFNHYTVARADSSTIDVYLAEAEAKTACPTVVLFGGSKALPVVMLRGTRTVSTLMFFEHLSRRDGVNIVVVEKRGLRPFSPAPRDREEAGVWERAAFEQGLYLKQTRVDDGVAVARALLADSRFRDLHLVGHSEGADIITAVARQLGREHVRSLALMAGAGPTRFFEATQQARAQSGSAGAKVVFDKEIRITATSQSPRLEDLHEASYAISSTPLDDVRGLHIPLFVASGDRDQKVPVAASDVFVAELLRDPAQPLHYLLLPGLDHSFLDPQGRDHSGRLWASYLEWVKAGPLPARSVKLGLP